MRVDDADLGEVHQVAIERRAIEAAALERPAQVRVAHRRGLAEQVLDDGDARLRDAEPRLAQERLGFPGFPLSSLAHAITLAYVLFATQSH